MRGAVRRRSEENRTPYLDVPRVPVVYYSVDTAYACAVSLTRTKYPSSVGTDRSHTEPPV